jgi:hypothetical protein
MYRPDLRYTPREVDHGDTQGERAAVPPVNNQPPQRPMGRSEMPLPQSGNGYSGGHAQPIDHGNSARSGPRPPPPPPVPFRPMDLPRDPGLANLGYPGPPQPTQQDRYHDPRYPTQPKDARAAPGNSNLIGPGAAQHHQVPAASNATNERLETREDPWEFLFGSKGYTTLAPGDERPFWWDWKD